MSFFAVSYRHKSTTKALVLLCDEACLHKFYDAMLDVLSHKLLWEQIECKYNMIRLLMPVRVALLNLYLNGTFLYASLRLALSRKWPKEFKMEMSVIYKS